MNGSRSPGWEAGSPVRRLAGALLVLVLLAGACSRSGGSKFSGAPGGGTGGAGPDRVASLTIAVAEDLGPLNLYINSEAPLVELVYDKLLAPSPYVAEPKPWLAKTVRAIDPSTWEVELREGVTWHDGKPFTADDVVFTFEYFRATPSNRWTHHVSEVPKISSVTAVEASKVRFECAYPCPQLGPVTLADLPIIPKHVWEGVDNPAKLPGLPVGTGPYRLAEYQAGQLYRFEANREYFQGPPAVGELVMPIIQDASTTFAALRSGEIDAAVRPLAPELIDRFRQLPDIGLLETSPLNLVELRLNHDRAPFSDPFFRSALSMAVDRKALVETVTLGRGRPGSLGYPHPDSPWTNSQNRQPSDPARGRTFLDELGFADRDGDGVREAPGGDQPLEFTLKVSGTEPTQVRAAELVAGQLGKAGIQVTVTPLDPGTIRALFQNRDFDMAIGVIGAHGVGDPDQFIMSHRSGYLWKAGVPYPEWDELSRRWDEADTAEARKQISFEMQTLFNRQPTSIALYYPEETFAFRKSAFGGWAEARGYGMVHKWSLLAPQVRQGAVETASGR